jgi:hypothetical protein
MYEQARTLFRSDPFEEAAILKGGPDVAVLLRISHEKLHIGDVIGVKDEGMFAGGGAAVDEAESAL